MTLGRTSSGAIKIKTDEAGGGLRAVECACCGGCGCNYHSILANPSDPDFAARVLGTALNSFTQISISGSISVVDSDGNTTGGAIGDLGAWDASTGYFYRSWEHGSGTVNAYVVLQNNCLQVMVLEEFSVASFITTQEACPFTDFNGTELPTEPDDACPITINGVNYRTARRAYFGETVTGSATITFS